jgi:hypothetical protein
MLSLLIYAVVVVFVVILLIWLIDFLPAPPNLRTIFKALIVIVGVVAILSRLVPLAGT